MNEDIKKNELSEAQLVDVSGGSDGALSVCKQCGSTGPISSSTQLCANCHNKAFMLEHFGLNSTYSGGSEGGGMCTRCGGNTIKKRIVENGNERDVIACESCSSILKYLDLLTSMPQP